MYLKTPGSRKHIIKDLYTVWLPPIPAREEILFHDLKRSDQFWRRTPLPKFYEERRAEEAYYQEKEKILVDEGAIPRVKHFDPVLENYRRQEWHRRIYGVHFMNNGEPVYLGPLHYWFLQWCKADHSENEGYPFFYMPQVNRFYFRQLCHEDPFSLGYMIVGPRGGGKTLEEVACQLENLTRPGHRRHAAIQSKNKEEAEEIVFQEKMVPMFNALPDFFKPQFAHGSDPRNTMIFKRPSVKGKEAKNVKHGDEFELGNTIRAYAPKNKSLDGKTLADVINDEIGKLNPEKDQDAYTRHSTNVRTVFRNQRKVGIIRATTTIEEMEQGGDDCEQIWLESDPRVRDANGYTVSRIYKYFVSAVETQTQLADKFGYIPENEAFQVIMNERAPVLKDSYKLSLLMRKNPTTEQEAFLRDQSKSIYDVMILSKRLGELKLMKAQDKFRKYKIEWVNGKVDGDVELVEHREGPLTLFYEPDEFWGKDRKFLNACKFTTDRNGKKLWLPCNNDLIRAATDPIKSVKTDDPRASKMAAHGGFLYIPDLDNGKEDDRDWVSKNLVWEYFDRQTDPDENYEDLIKLIRYFGHSIMPENNAGEFTKHLIGRGYSKFVIVRRDFDPTVLTNKHTKNSLSGEQAVHSTTETIESYVRRTKAFVRRHGHRINSIPLIEQLLKFDPKKPTSTDLAVSFGYWILAMEAELDDYFTTQKDTEMVMNYFQRYDISGSQSRALSMPSTSTGEDVSDFDDPNYLQQLMYGQ